MPLVLTLHHMAWQTSLHHDDEPPWPHGIVQIWCARVSSYLLLITVLLQIQRVRQTSLLIQTALSRKAQKHQCLLSLQLVTPGQLTARTQLC